MKEEKTDAIFNPDKNKNQHDETVLKYIWKT